MIRDCARCMISWSDMKRPFTSRIKTDKNRIKVHIHHSALFLVLLMIVPDSSKIIFLVLWIVSLFAIAVYLIGVEYVDYKLQEKMNEISGCDAQSVSPVVQIEDRVQEIAERVEQKFDTMQQSTGEDAEQ